jgi:hypothetical protein
MFYLLHRLKIGFDHLIDGMTKLFDCFMRSFENQFKKSETEIYITEIIYIVCSF